MGIGAAFNRGRLLFERGVYYFQHAMLAGPLPGLNAALMVVPLLRIGTRAFIANEANVTYGANLRS